MPVQCVLDVDVDVDKDITDELDSALHCGS